MSKKRANGEGSVTKSTRNNKPYYTAQVTIGTDDNGKLIRRSKSSYKKADVTKWLVEQQFNAERGLLSIAEDVQFADYFYDWIFIYKKSTISNNTFSIYESTYRKYIKESSISKIKVKSLKTLELQQYFNRMNEDNVSQSMLKKIRTKINACLIFAVKDGLIYKNPMEAVVLPQKNKNMIDTTKKRRAFTQAEQTAFVNYIKDSDDILDLLILFDFLTGLRLGEITALTWDDLDGEVLSVNKQYQFQYYIEPDGTKTRKFELINLKTSKSIRSIELPPAAIKLLEKTRYKYLEKKMKAGKYFNDNNLIFSDDLGNPIERKRPFRHIKKICAELNIDTSMNFHSIRHSFATRLFELGINAKVVQELMGHEDLQTTLNIYTHVSDTVKRDAAERLDTIFNF